MTRNYRKMSSPRNDVGKDAATNLCKDVFLASPFCCRFSKTFLRLLLLAELTLSKKNPFVVVAQFQRKLSHCKIKNGVNETSYC